MVTGAQIIGGTVPAIRDAATADTAEVRTADGLFGEIFGLMSAQTEAVTALGDTGQAGTPPEEKPKRPVLDTEGNALLASLLLAASAQTETVQTLKTAFAGNGAEPVPTTGGETVHETEITGILERTGTSGSMDAAASSATDAQKVQMARAKAYEEILARMPQSVHTGGAAASQKLENEVNPCPLENTDDTATARAGTDAGLPTETLDAAAGFAQETENAFGDGAASGDESRTAPQPVQHTETEAKTQDALEVRMAAFSVETAAEAPQQGGGTAAATESAMLSIESALSSYDGNGTRRIEIQLEPECLGKLSISVSMGKDGLTARISTENSEIQSILSGQLGQLADKLAQSGIHIQSMDVSCFDPGNFQQQSGRNTGREHRNSARQGGLSISDETADLPAGLYEFYVQTEDNDASMDCRA